MTDKILLEMRDVAKAYGSRLLFRNLNLYFRKGEGTLLTGANGCGKSTLLRLAAGLSRPSSGKILMNAQFAFLGHSSFLYPGLTALENLAFWYRANWGKVKNSILEKTLDLVGLLPYAHDRVQNFSRGMAQRLNFARVFLGEPQLFLLDEPFSGIDQASYKIILEELQKRKKAGAAILMISHNPEEDGVIADTIYVMAKKRLWLAENLEDPENARDIAALK